MNKRKKSHGGLKVLLLVLFIMLLGTSSTCYANITEDYFLYTIHNLRDNGNIYSSLTTKLNNVTDTSLKQAVPLINERLATNNLQNLDDKNLIVIPSYSGGYIYLIFSNCSYPNGYDNLGYLKLYGAGMNNVNNGYWVYITSNSSDPIYYIQCSISGSTYNISVGSSLTSITSGQTLNGNLSFNGTNAFSDNLEIFYMQNVSAYNLTQTVYTSYPITGSGNVASRFIRNYVAYNNSDNTGVFYEPTPEPEEPSGDTSGEGGTGTITSPSGEVTGQIDLSGIENGITQINDSISGEGQAIRDTISGESEKIINAVSSANENYWGSGDSLTGEEQEEQIEENLNELMNNISGELSNSEIIKGLEEAEEGFLSFFRTHENEQAYDLEFQWNTITYQNAKLIESGEINISKMCREIPKLGELQTLIRVIFNFATAIYIVKQVYNLVLSTLGIDNPYLYEDETVDERIDIETGEYKGWVRKRRRKLR